MQSTSRQCSSSVRSLTEPAVLSSGCTAQVLQWLSAEQSDAAAPEEQGMKSDNRALLKLHSNIKDFIFSFKVRNVFRYENVVLRYLNAQKDFCKQSLQ